MNKVHCVTVTRHSVAPYLIYRYITDMLREVAENSIGCNVEDVVLYTLCTVTEIIPLLINVVFVHATSLCILFCNIATTINVWYLNA